MGTGTDAAIEAADLTLLRGDLLAIPDVRRFGPWPAPHGTAHRGLGA